MPQAYTIQNKFVKNSKPRLLSCFFQKVTTFSNFCDLNCKKRALCFSEGARAKLPNLCRCFYGNCSSGVYIPTVTENFQEKPTTCSFIAHNNNLCFYQCAHFVCLENKYLICFILATQRRKPSIIKKLPLAQKSSYNERTQFILRKMPPQKNTLSFFSNIQQVPR